MTQIDLEELIAQADQSSRKRKPNAIRQARLKAARRASGLEQVTLWVPASEASAIRILADFLCRTPVAELDGGRVVHRAARTLMRVR